MLSDPKLVEVFYNQLSVGCFAQPQPSRHERLYVLEKLKQSRNVPHAIESVSVVFDDFVVLEVERAGQVKRNLLTDFYLTHPYYLRSLVRANRFTFAPVAWLLEWEQLYCQ